MLKIWEHKGNRISEILLTLAEITGIPRISFHYSDTCGKPLLAQNRASHKFLMPLANNIFFSEADKINADQCLILRKKLDPIGKVEVRLSLGDGS